MKNQQRCQTGKAQAEPKSQGGWDQGQPEAKAKWVLKMVCGSSKGASPSNQPACVGVWGSAGRTGPPGVVQAADSCLQENVDTGLFQLRLGTQGYQTADTTKAKPTQAGHRGYFEKGPCKSPSPPGNSKNERRV